LELSGRFGKSPKKQREWEPALRVAARTHHENTTLNPVWNVKGIRFQLKRHGAVLKVRVFDHDDLAADDPLGHVVLYLNHIGIGIHEGWWPLCDPQDSQALSTLTVFEPVSASTQTISGPAIRLRVTLNVNSFGEFFKLGFHAFIAITYKTRESLTNCIPRLFIGELVSYLWSPPKVVKPTPPRFDPNLFFGYANSIKSKVVDSMLFCVTAVTDAIFWKRGPSYTFAVLGVALLVCQHIEAIWMVLHSSFAVAIAATGIITKCGAEALRPPALFASLMPPATPPPAPTTPSSPGGSDAASARGSPVVSKKKKSTSTYFSHTRPSISSNTSAAEEGAAEPEDSALEVEKPKIFTGITEITLRKVGRTIGSAPAEAQEAIRQAMVSVAMLEGLVRWERCDFKLGFGQLDGPVMATGFVIGNLAMVMIHAVVPLRYIATLAVVMIFFNAIFEPLSTLLPQGLKVRQARASMLLADGSINHRPTPSDKNRKSRQGFAPILRGIFRRVDIDGEVY
jgi:hypothetical protein